MQVRTHRSAIRASARTLASLLALFSLLSSARLDLLAVALGDTCCCHQSERPHDENCPCKMCTHKRHAGAPGAVVTTCAGLLDAGLTLSPPDPVASPMAMVTSSPVVRVRAQSPVLEAAPEPAIEVPTPPPLRHS
jgi:hypothetical protein